MGVSSPDDRTPAGSLAVVHLVRAGNPPETLARFLESYRRHRSGAEHQFVLLLKGFTVAEELEAVRAAAADLHPEEIHVSDDGFDLRAYFEVVRRTHYDWLCFLNSFSAVRADGWLSTLYEAASTPGVGIAGATGSWASMRSHSEYYLGGIGHYRTVFDNRAHFREQTQAMARPNSRVALPARRPLRDRASSVIRQLRLFEPFPAVHLRTNGFIARRQTLARVETGPLMDKQQHFELESSRRSLTAQITGMGLGTLLCGADGTMLEPLDWASGDIFWQADQANLLIEDNQTEFYARADARRRDFLARFAWGRQARPVPGEG